ncbi:UDP-3-O-(3-hydroxymyristoyl)glucosamine N-acyltransferase [Bradyrhizobium sp. WSM471]|uniref:UDP-3-O-(3-hydroxymyristoyl)glucosamine N-acyltransferase n=1 Tax=Bradyrhizobium sp. WSM471 TaxID=319017 RepID=UPI00024D2275|nr:MULTISPECIES: UDP-3-O-(3-hydroxymyristoyl)glucosamine N-acyltransferase [Bradyrhizobium]EHR01920.1 UDP-3-O-(3-hydroxymyristoyl) glucosamine N-acyltransferase [Bradyrhizobium sp. WSM471]UFW43947.1 UDP-3-O-(3-hydroxymyristoyl)glucosamine N-acyltransferase [Bradyrhizobium canariense]
MRDGKFFDSPAGLTVARIISLTGAECHDATRLSHLITNVAPLELAGPNDLAFIESGKYADALTTTRAGACLMLHRFENCAPSTLISLLAKQPYQAFVDVHSELYPRSLRPTSVYEASDIASGSMIHPTARLAGGITVDPGAVIGPRAEIGAGSIISATAVIGPDVLIGRNCTIGAGCSITHTLMGERVVIHPGSHIGQDGFGYVAGVRWQKVPQTGRVIIHDDVEIGAGTTIDRGGIRDTIIGEATKIDNLCQIGHNVVIGRNCIIVAQSGLSGSVTIEDFVVLGGRVAIAPHVTIGKGARVAGGSGVMTNVPPGTTWGGYPARPRMQWMRQLATLARLTKSGI